jgi:hypothetical protein
MTAYVAELKETDGIAPETLELIEITYLVTIESMNNGSLTRASMFTPIMYRKIVETVLRTLETRERLKTSVNCAKVSNG